MLDRLKHVRYIKTTMFPKIKILLTFTKNTKNDVASIHLTTTRFLKINSHHHDTTDVHNYLFDAKNNFQRT